MSDALRMHVVLMSCDSPWISTVPIAVCASDADAETFIALATVAIDRLVEIAESNGKQGGLTSVEFVAASGVEGEVRVRFAAGLDGVPDAHPGVLALATSLIDEAGFYAHERPRVWKAAVPAWVRL